jgi:hypothetical protein
MMKPVPLWLRLAGVALAGLTVVGCGGTTSLATSPAAHASAAPSPRPTATYRVVSGSAPLAAVNKICRLGNLDYQLYLGKHPKASVSETAREFTLTRQQILHQARVVRNVSGDILQALNRGVTLAVQAQVVVEQHKDGHPLIAASMGLAKTLTGLGLSDCARVR